MRAAFHARGGAPEDACDQAPIQLQLRAYPERFVNDSIVLRHFCRLYLESTPDETTLIRWANVIGSQTVASLNERAVELARSLKISRGRKLSGCIPRWWRPPFTIPPTALLWARGQGCSLSLASASEEDSLHREEVDRLGKGLLRTPSRSGRRTEKQRQRTKPGLRERKQKR